MLIEIASFLIINTNQIKEIYVRNANNHSNISSRIIPGDSTYQTGLRLEQERKASELARRRREVLAREVERSYGTGGQATKLYQDYTNNCVLWAKKQTGISHPIGAGGRASIQGQEPKVGAIAVEKGSPHASVVKEVQDGYLIIHESNYTKNWITQRRVAINNFIGFIYR